MLDIDIRVISEFTAHNFLLFIKILGRLFPISDKRVDSPRVERVFAFLRLFEQKAINFTDIHHFFVSFWGNTPFLFNYGNYIYI